MSIISWDTKESTKATLSEKQKDSIFDLTVTNDNRPYPKKLNREVRITPKKDDEEKVQMQLATQFYSWLGSIEDEIEKEEEEEHDEFIEHLNDQLSRCSALMEEIDNGLSHLSKLHLRYTEVSNSTNALHEACEHLLGDQTELMEKAKCLEEAVRYFNNLDNILIKLTSPSLRISAESLQPILSQIDESLQHIQRHPEYKESGIYQSKINECLAKVMALVKNNVIQSLEKSIDQLTDEKERVNTDNAFTVLYAKFRVQGVKIRCLMELIEERLEVNEEYKRAVVDCQQFYVSKRESLLSGVVQAAVGDLVAQYPRDNCSFLRSGCALMVRLCEDETQLYAQFFSTRSQALTSMLERICLNLYDAFRPSLIHINHMETLAELCTILKVELMEEHVYDSQTDLDVFLDLCQTILADVQERLVYRTHVYSNSQILGFVPSPGDLAYPDKLVMMKNISDGFKSNESTNLSSGAIQSSAVQTGDLVVTPGSHMSLTTADMHGMWYPTVRRTLICLSKLSRCLDTTSFQGLAQDCISMCVQSLVHAADKISTDHTPVDGQLFLIKHLLILREQVAPFNIEFAVKETSLGFNRIKHAAVGLLSAKSRLISLNRTNAVLNFLLETPEVIETVADSRRQVDGQLKATCELFINQSVAKFISKSQDFLKKVATIEELNAQPNSPQVALRDQPFTSVESLQSMSSDIQRCLSQHLSALQTSLSLYLANPDTEHILFRPIRSEVQKNIRSINALLEKEFSEEDRQIIAWPTDEQLNLLMQMKN